MASALGARPDLWATAVGAAWDARSNRSVLPSRDVIRWRIATAYGSADGPVNAVDVVHFLEWRRALTRYIEVAP